MSKNLIIAYVYFQKNGGLLTLEDLASHQSEWVDSVFINYKTCNLSHLMVIWQASLPSQGFVTLEALKIVESILTKNPNALKKSCDKYHIIYEAMSYAFEDAIEILQNEDFTMEDALSEDNIRKRAESITSAKSR